MYLQRRMVRQALIKLGLLVTLVVLALSACGGGGEEQARGRSLPEGETALRPGEYHSTEFEPSFSFRVGKGWRSFPDFPEGSDKLVISQGERIMDQSNVLVFRNVHEVFKYTERCTRPKVVEAPKDMVGWFQHHPCLKTKKPEPVTVGGVKGVQFDYVLAEDAPFGGIKTFRYADGLVASPDPEQKSRAIILEDVKGETVTISVTSAFIVFDEFLPKAQKVLDTVKWGGS